ncbi:hypothetical protein [Winogradskya consettensis]|nr:hypothetical protein [Actinoplanes consettensis]
MPVIPCVTMLGLNVLAVNGPGVDVLCMNVFGMNVFGGRNGVGRLQGYS